ncbi:response regulator [Nocardia sp. CDC159]|uniref:histidine kinase n=1 Tax=Nocardia pulmonis TaxID=2951408 RepID=A0A9X2E3L1_9NOCA|nr:MULTISPECIES: response regulator [Nocardia]MCM6772443.1 response regulator [Nocardia pulmonis]MCM6784899.1 response regulator [Nocardia sp. CDC159]
MRLAVVEDDDGVGDALVAALTVRGHQAKRMRRGADLLIAHRGYDAVILDLGLPDGDGLQVLRQLREVSTVPVVILTARSDERSIVRGLRGNADDYVIKPPRIAELVARLENVTRRAAVAAAVRDSQRAQRQIVADTAHAMRNPLTALTIRLDPLGPAIPDHAAATFRGAVTETDRLTSLLDGLLTRADRLVPDVAAGTQFLDMRSLIGTDGIPLHTGAAAVYRRYHG